MKPKNPWRWKTSLGFIIGCTILGTLEIHRECIDGDARHFLCASILFVSVAIHCWIIAQAVAFEREMKAL